MTVAMEPLVSWGRTRMSRSRRHHVVTPDEVRGALRSARPAAIVRGFGRSYGDVCLNDGGDVLDLTRGARIHVFDTERGIIECDAGVSLRTISELAIPAGWVLPVCPGTAIVSVGGAIANDVHGKEQHAAGNFGHHVIWFDLVLPDGTLTRVSPESDASLFRATVAGIGLTGVIVRAALRLVRLTHNAYLSESRRLPSVARTIEHLVEDAAHYTHMVAWVDLLTPGSAFGRTVLERARIADVSVPAVPPRRALTVPLLFPEFVLNPLTMRIFNAAYAGRASTSLQQRIIPAQRFHFPLDALREWHRAYGRRGLIQFQFSVRLPNAVAAVDAVLAELRRSRRGSYLAVLKLVGREGAGMLSFSRPGISLALDFPGGSESVALVHRLQEIVLAHDAVIYLAKDSCLRPEEFRRMYPQLAAFEALLDRIDPTRRMQSDMSRRLGIRTAR